VSGHPEFSGGYDVETAAALGIGAKENENGNYVLNAWPLKSVELLIAKFNGNSRIVAANNPIPANEMAMGKCQIVGPPDSHQVVELNGRRLGAYPNRKPGEPPVPRACY